MSDEIISWLSWKPPMHTFTMEFNPLATFAPRFLINASPLGLLGRLDGPGPAAWRPARAQRHSSRAEPGGQYSPWGARRTFTEKRRPRRIGRYCSLQVELRADAVGLPTTRPRIAAMAHTCIHTFLTCPLCWNGSKRENYTIVLSFQLVGKGANE
jgi:hypothetical protein